MTLGVLAVAAVSGIRSSPLSPTLPAGAHPLAPFRWAADALGLQGLSGGGKVAAALVALGLASSTFLFALRAAWRRSLGVPIIVGMGIAFQVLAVAMPLFISHDVYQYSMYGRILSVHHANPYVATAADFRSDPLFPFVSAEWRHVPAFYGPLFVHVTAVVTRAVRTPAGLIWAFKAIAAVATTAAVGLTAWIVHRVWPERAAFGVALVAWNPVVVFYLVAGGHADALIALCLAAALSLLVLSRGPASSGKRTALGLGTTALLTLAVLVKSTLAIALAVEVLVVVRGQPRTRRTRTLAAHLGVVLALGALFVVPFLSRRDPTLGLAQLSSWSNYGTASSFLQLLLGQSVGSTVTTHTASLLASIVRFSMFGLFGLGFVAVLWRLWRTPEPDLREVCASLGWVLLLFLLAAPILWAWYLVWFLPVAWALPRAPRIVVIGMSIGLPFFESIGERSIAPQLSDDVIVLGAAVLGATLLVALVRLLQDLGHRVRREVPFDMELGAAPGRGP